MDNQTEFQLAVEDTVEVPVKFTFKAGRVNKSFSFTVFCDRLDQDEINERRKTPDMLVTDFMRPLMKGWKDQLFVLDSHGKPADFSEGARDVMLNAAGVGTVIFNSYLKEVGAKEKN
jgi:hypothetical protein